MMKTRIPRKAKVRKLGAVPPTQKLNEPTDEDEELEAIRASDFAKAPGETPIPYEQVLRKIEQSRR